MSDEIPKLQKILNEPEPLWVKEKQPSILATDGKHHLLPGSELSMWAHGVIQVTLDTLPNAIHDYAVVTESWNHPDFDPLYTAALSSQLLEHPEKPMWGVSGDQIKDTVVIQEQRIRIHQFIRNYFNSQKHIDRGRIIVNADQAHYLVSALIFRSQSDCFGLALADWERKTLAPAPDEMADPNSRYRRLVMNTLSDIQAHLTENKTILRWSHVWRLCRVDPGQIALAATELGDGLHPDLWNVKHKVADDDYIRHNIHDADKATGYL